MGLEEEFVSKRGRAEWNDLVTLKHFLRLPYSKQAVECEGKQRDLLEAAKRCGMFSTSHMYCHRNTAHHAVLKFYVLAVPVGRTCRHSEGVAY